MVSPSHAVANGPAVEKRPSPRRAAGLSVAALFALNTWIAWRLFWTEYTTHMGSIEGVFVSLTRYMRDHWSDLSWFPLWFGGMPFENTYQPLLPAVAAAVSGLGGISAARAYHVAFGAAYVAGPVALFWLLARLTTRIGPALLGALAYSLLSPSAFLIPAIRADLGGMLLARRLHTGLAYADSPHVAALTLVPLALAALDLAMERMTLARLVFAAVGVAAVVLTNIPGAIVLGMAVIALAVSCRGAVWASIVRLGIACALGGLITLLWTPPSTFRTIFANTRWMEPADQWGAARVIQLGILAISVAVAVWGLRRIRASRALEFGVAFTLISGAVVFGWFWAGQTLIAQPSRFHLGFEMAFACALAGILAAIPPPRRRWIAWTLGAVLTCLVIVQAVNYRRFAKQQLRPLRMEDRGEFQVARWLEENARGARVMAPGSHAFWLNAFTDTPQIIGCCDQGLLLRITRMAHYVIGSDDGAPAGHEGEISIAWFKALGVRYVIAPGPGEPFHDLQHPAKFAGVLREVWHRGDDRIYEVPQRDDGLAHAVLPTEVVSIPPENGIRVDRLAAYVESLDRADRPTTTSAWLNSRELRIRGRYDRSLVVSVQIPWHSSWRATANGRPRKISQDALGFMVISPECDGDCDIRLRFERTWHW